jgi:DNA N-6-adenine-methyltransferase (Dam).
MTNVPANPRHSSAKENWGTPPWIVEAARRVMGSIDLDPASSEEANKVVRAGCYFTKEDDGLSGLWNLHDERKLNVWLNPPGGKTVDGKSKVKLWWQKKLTQREGPGCEYSLLDFPTCFFKRRVDFIDPVTGKPVKGNTHSSCITYVPGSLNETDYFYEVFSEFGKIVGHGDGSAKSEPQRYGEWAGVGIMTNDIGPLP